MDRTTFQELSHMIVERPNFGYDFGGYRDGVWLIGKLGLRPREVLFLNDSVWFPILKNATLLAEMRATSQDYVGTQVFGDVTADGRKQGFFWLLLLPHQVTFVGVESFPVVLGAVSCFVEQGSDITAGRTGILAADVRCCDGLKSALFTRAVRRLVKGA
jgi:hypothetical protein